MTTKEAAQCFAQAGAVIPPDLAAPTASKYNARKKMVDGHMFDSSGEAEAYCILRLWEKAGIIQHLTIQPEFKLVDRAPGRRAIWYRADFRFLDTTSGKWRVVDYKGFKTPVFRLKLKLMAERYPDVTVEIWDRKTIR